MTRIQFAYIKEGPSDSVKQFYERYQYEMLVYSMLAKFEDMGLKIVRESDGRAIPGKYYYLEFDSEEEAALFKLTHM